MAMAIANVVRRLYRLNTDIIPSFFSMSRGFPSLCSWLHLCLVFPLFSELLVKLAGERSLRPAPKRFLPLGPLANGIEINANESTIHNNNTAERTKYDKTTIIMTRFIRKSNSEEDEKGFSSPYLCSRVVLNSGHPVQKSKCGACAVTGYCSFKVALNYKTQILSPLMQFT